MNNQIRELAEQAGFYFYDMHNVDGQDLGETVEADSWRVPEAFAKLIIQECLEQVRDEVQYEYDWKLADAVTKRVLEHFGVK